jgi:dCTP deaminase
MIIPDYMLMEWARFEEGLTPFAPELINPASVDLRWSGRVKTMMIYGDWSEMFECDRLALKPNGLYLLDTLEYIKVPSRWAGLLALKSSMGRLGLEHLHAGFFDPGFEGTATLEIKNMRPSSDIVLTKGQRIVQMVFYQMVTVPDRDYHKTGRYNGQNKPQEAITK